MKTKDKLPPTDKMFTFTFSELFLFTIMFSGIVGVVGYGVVALVLMAQALVGG